MVLKVADFEYGIISEKKNIDILTDFFKTKLNDFLLPSLFLKLIITLFHSFSWTCFGILIITSKYSSFSFDLDRKIN
jgi:hypothetical protein